MGTLTGKQIDNTYDGLIKTDDEQPINATPKRLQDGLGNDLPVKVGTAGMVYDGAQDFTNATVTGISATDTTYTLGVEESVPDGIITLTASDGSPAQEIVLQAQGNISMDTTLIANELNVTVEPYTINSAQDGADVDITLDRSSAQSNVTLQAGTNITLTNTGNNITIDAAGGASTTYELGAVDNGVNADLKLVPNTGVTTTVSFTPGANIGLDVVNGDIQIDADNTTYDYGAVGAAGNINFALTGSDTTNDVVTMQAGTNITLTDNGSNTFTIDAAGGGGSSKSTVITTGVVNAWVGPAGQDTIVAQVLIPANTITGAATIEFRSPVSDNGNNQFNYSSLQIAPTPGDFSFINLLGRQSPSGSPEHFTWYRSIMVGANGTAYYTDQNSYFWPQQTVDPVNQIPMDWTVDQYFTISVWCDDPGASWEAYSPSLTITNV